MIPELYDFWTQLYECVTYGCAWGFRDSETGALLKKGWRIAFSDQDCARRLSRKCSGDHEHKVIEGSARLSADSAIYPVKLCKAFVA